MHRLVKILAVLLVVGVSSYAFGYPLLDPHPQCFDLPMCEAYEFQNLQYSHECSGDPRGLNHVYINHQVTPEYWCLYGPIQP